MLSVKLRFMENLIWSTGHQLKFDNIVEANNCHLTDSSGNQWVDLESGVWSTSIGHSNPRIAKLISEQAGKLMHTGFCYCSALNDRTSKKILEINSMPGGKCEFLTSGSEAVEYAMRIARRVSQKPLALTFSDSYNGAYGDVSMPDPSSWFIHDRFGCGCNDPVYGCSGNCKSFREIPFHEIGIFLLEPGSSSGLVRFASDSLINRIVHQVKSAGGIVVANEVTTGIGRTGKWFGYQHYQVNPGLVAMGKGLGNGYPVSAVAVSHEILNNPAFEGFHFSQSHQNDALGAAIAGEVIDIISENELVKSSEILGEYLKTSLLVLKEETTLIKEVRGRGLMLAIEFTSCADAIYNNLILKGFITGRRRGTEVLRLDPALTIDLGIIDQFIATLRGLLLELTDEKAQNTCTNNR